MPLSSNSVKYSKNRPQLRDEKEIRSVQYENFPDLNVLSNPGSSVNELYRNISSSKDDEELSLEVEITDSLKHLICTAEKCDSELLDVTIVRPSDMEPSSRLDYKTSSFRGCEIRKLLAAMEKERRNQKRLIEHLPKAPNVKEDDIRENKNALRRDLHVKSEAYGSRRLTNPKNYRQKTSDDQPTSRKKLFVMSAPTKNNAREYYQNSAVPNNIRLKQLAGDSDVESASIDVLKPLVGEIHESLRNLEAKIVKVGKQNEFDSGTSGELVPDLYYQQRLKCLTSEMEGHSNAQQIYATANNFNNLKKLLSCQKMHRGEEEKSERPCLCQHCGMLGVLIDSQKRPAVTIPLDNDSPRSKIRSQSKHERRAYKEPIQSSCTGNNNSQDNKTKNYKNLCVISDLSSRVKALETRIGEQEKHAVPKEYFKRVINKILVYYNSKIPHTIKPSNLEELLDVKDNSVQCDPQSLQCVTEKNMYKEAKHNAYQNLKKAKITREKSYCLNPVSVESEKNQTYRGKAFGENNTSTKSRNATMSIISDFFSKFNKENIDIIQEVDEKSTDQSVKILSDKKETTQQTEDRNLHWGEDVIKPGFDLRGKIVTLLEEQLRNLNITKPKLENKNQAKTSDAPDDQEPNQTLEPSMKIPSLPENEKTQEDINIELLTNATHMDPKETIKTFLDIMSQRVYDEHIKKCAPSAKKSCSNLNTADIRNDSCVKTDMPNRKSITPKNIDSYLKTPRTKYTDIQSIGLNLIEQRKAALDNLGIKVFHSTERMETCQNPNISNNEKANKDIRKSLIPRRIAPLKHSENDLQNNAKNLNNVEDKTDKREMLTTQKTASERYKDVSYVKSHLSPNSVRITYVNPKASNWQQDSCTSIDVESQRDKASKIEQRENFSKYYNSKEIPIYTRERKSRMRRDELSGKGKLEFLQNIASSKNAEKEQLWNNIWQQVKKHNKRKQDKIIIQVPKETSQNNHDKKFTEVEFTIEDIQRIINKTKLPRKKSYTSCDSASSKYSSAALRSKMQHQAHKDIICSTTKRSRWYPKLIKNSKFVV